MQYNGPIIHTYLSDDQYRSDAANMARHGYQVKNVQTQKVPKGRLLSAIAAFGALLAPLGIGLLVLFLLPEPLSTRFTVTYIPVVPGAVPPTSQIWDDAPPESYVDTARAAILTYWQRGLAFRVLLITLIALAAVVAIVLLTLYLTRLRGPH